MEASIRTFQHWLAGTDLSFMMNNYIYAWRISESIHFSGLCLLIGTVGLFDLRMVGFAREVPLGALHKLVPWGVLGYVLNIVTGVSFLAGAPDQYVYNIAFQFKILFMAVAGINVLAFYLTMYGKIRMLGSGESAPLPARIFGGVSLCCWIGVIVCGRLLTFYRPPSISCPWC